MGRILDQQLEPDHILADLHCKTCQIRLGRLPADRQGCKLLRQKVGPKVYLVANNTPSPAAARYLNGRMFESYDGRGDGWNQLTGGGETPGLLHTMRWRWHAPRLMILWRNEASPDAETIAMLRSSANRASRTGRDVAIGASDHRYGIAPPFGSR